MGIQHWDDYDGTATGETFQLTETTTTSGSQAGTFAPGSGGTVTTVAWFGYDATLDGDDVVVVYDEETYDIWGVCGLPGGMGAGAGGPQPQALAAASGSFTSAVPPPLASGLTQLMPAPDTSDTHQLKLIRLD